MRRNNLFQPLAIALLMTACAQSEALISHEQQVACDTLCWPKGLVSDVSKQQTLYCSRTFRTDEEGQYWKRQVESGALAVGKTATVRSADLAAQPGNNTYCQSIIRTSGSFNMVALSGFAYQANVCQLYYSKDHWEAGWTFGVAVCGVANNGTTANFFPKTWNNAPPPSP